MELIFESCCVDPLELVPPPPVPLVLAPESPEADFSWNSWKQGTMHKLAWQSGQWYLVLRLRIRP
jgi:hypothetical protein